MHGLLIRFAITWTAVFLAGYIIPGIQVETVGAGIAAAILLALLNAILRPILYTVSIPLIILTLGVFTVVINALLLELVAWLVQGFQVNGFWPAFWGAVVISIVSTILNLWVSGEGRWEIVSHESRRPPRVIN
ncbi:MAG TPA: phage holin family protein [Nitrospiraceae bacterium]|nr:phage holin family protein [Nitrospiraceae bacterium]